MLLSGKNFNLQYKENKFAKLTNDLENHNGYQFHTGSNVDSIPFNPWGECQAGGIYFCLLKKLPMWLDYTRTPMVYVRWVTIPDDAQIWVETNKFKADKMILSERQKIGDLEQWKDPLYCQLAVKLNYLSLQYVVEQTPELCLKAVKQWVYALQYVKEQTPELCLEAVKYDGLALKYVKEQTPELCLAAVKQGVKALQFVKNQTPELCLAAVNQNVKALQFVKNQTPELFLVAVKQNSKALRYVEKQTPE